MAGSNVGPISSPVPRWALPPGAPAPSPIDFSKLLDKLLPPPDGEDMARLRTGIISAVNANGTVDVGISGLVVPGVSRLASVVNLAVDAIVNILIWRGGILIIGATHMGAVPVMDFDSGQGTVTGSTYLLPTTANVGLAFIAPPSGMVRIDWSSELSANAAGSHVLLSPRVRVGASIGAGADVLAASDSIALRFRPTAISLGDTGIANFYLLDGLTPGSSYNLQLYGRINSASTATFEMQRVLVTPSP